jgi:hypothetical protein
MKITIHRSAFLTLAAALLGATAAPAQSPTFTVTATRPLGVFASAPRHAPDLHLVAAGDRLAPGLLLEARSGRSSSAFELEIGAASARCTIRGRAQSPQGPTLGGTCTEAAPTQGSIGLEVLLTAPAAVSCRLIATLSGTGSALPRTGCYAALGLRVGSSGGSWDTLRGAPLSLDLGVVVDPGGVPVRIDMEGLLAASEAGYEASVELRLVPEPVATPYGSSCATIRGRPFGASLSIQLQSGIRRGQAALLFGIRPLQQPLPFPGCTLLVDPVVVLGGYRTGIDGVANISLRLPPGPLDFRLQGGAADLTTGAVELTDGLVVTVPF